MTFTPASITSRFWAFVIDYIFLVMLSAFIVMLIAPFERWLPNWVMLTVLYILIGVWIFYLPLSETFMGGQTLGKRLMGLRTVRTDGSPASGVHCLQRFLMLSLDVPVTLGSAGLISSMVTKRRQRLGDLVADTMVVKANKDSFYSNNVTNEEYSLMGPVEQEIYQRNQPLNLHTLGTERFELARAYRAIECDLVWLRTHKGSPALVRYLESSLANLHLQLHRHKIYTWGDMLKFGLRSIPRAVYDSRWAIVASLVICVLGYIIGVYSQIIDPDFFQSVYGTGYAQMTLDNIESGNPMGVYSMTDETEFFFQVFLNNTMVALKLYAVGVLTLIGPLFVLLNNFVSFGTFDAFMGQQGYLAEAMIVPNEHGLLELWTFMMVGGASIRLGTGWLFPGRLTRFRALVRGARQSLLIAISAIPMLMIAAFIEGFITRHTEWPLPLRLSIIVFCAILILVYYVMLPLIAKHQ